MRYQNWDIASPRPQAAAQLEGAGLSPLLAAVLAARGMDTAQQARELLDPPARQVSSPLLLKDMDRAAARLRLAIQQRETVAVYGDYDVDGITSTCLLTDFLSRQGVTVIPYIPSRLDEGYGLNQEAVTALARRGARLIVTVDCGITAVEETALANRLGMDVVITDHHECKDALPDAAAVVDPCRPDCPSPFKALAGVGVALKLAMAVVGPEREGAVLEEYADLAAVGTIADVMEMTGENRTIVRLGLKQLERPRRLGLAALLQYAGLEGKPLTSVSVGYTLAPRINASGRMGQAMLAVELLLTRDPQRADELAQTLCQLNRERQNIELDIFQDCVTRLEQQPQQGVTVLSDEGWHQGVVGIVASRLSEKLCSPCFMVCLDHGMGKGSCRSYGGINLFQALSECSHLLEGFGGHALAAGFTVREENIPALAQGLRRAALRQLDGQAPVSVLKADAAVSPSLLTVENIQALDALEPCGTGNPRPVLVLSGATVQSMTQVGRGRHLKLRLEARGTVLDAIFFSADAGQFQLTPGCRVDAAFYPQINEFRGVRSVQLQILDLRPALTRAQQERLALEKYFRGEALSPDEGRCLLPLRTDFVALWRWLERQAARTPLIQDSPEHIARGVARSCGRPEVPARTVVCLKVMEERGLITLAGREQLSITLCRPEQKVDLEDSHILRRLHRFAGD